MQHFFGILIRMFWIFGLLSALQNASAETHSTLSGTTNYVWRMYSKSRNEPAIQANIDYQHLSGFFAGASVSSFNLGKSEVREDFHFQNQARVEISPYIGWSTKLVDHLNFAVQYSRYFYDGKIFDFSGDYNEFSFLLNYKDLLGLHFSFIDDFYGMGKVGFNYEATGRYPITDYLEFSSTFGYAQLNNALSADYPYWNVGFTGRYKFISLDLRYHDAREIYTISQNASPDHPETLKATVVFTLSVGF